MKRKVKNERPHRTLQQLLENSRGKHQRLIPPRPQQRPKPHRRHHLLVLL